MKADEFLIESSNIEVGDKITWWYNKFHPNYEGIVRKVSGNNIVVYAPGSGQLYQLHRDDIRSVKKKKLDELRIDNEQGWGQTPNNANVDYLGLKVKMEPQMFLRLAAKLQGDVETPEKIKAMIAHQQSGGAFGAPTLYIAIPRAWEAGDFSGNELPRVTGHEGRHRMSAEIEMTGGYYTETHIFISGFRTKNWAKDNQSDYTPEIIERLRNGPIETEDGLTNTTKNRFILF